MFLTGVTAIKYEAFSDCENLLSVVIPESVQEISKNAFRGCELLSGVQILGKSTTVGERAFMNCNIENLTHPCLTIKNGLAIESSKVLYFTKPAEKIVIPDGITEIEEQAFQECKMVSVVIPKSVKKIGWVSFVRCKKLRSIDFGGTVAEWQSMEKDDFWNDEVPAKCVKCSDGETKLAD